MKCEVWSVECAVWSLECEACGCGVPHSHLSTWQALVFQPIHTYPRGRRSSSSQIRSCAPNPPTASKTLRSTTTSVRRWLVHEDAPFTYPPLSHPPPFTPVHVHVAGAPMAGPWWMTSDHPSQWSVGCGGFSLRDRAKAIEMCRTPQCITPAAGNVYMSIHVYIRQ